MKEEAEDYTVSEVIGKFKATLDQEILVLKSNDWSEKETLSDRVGFYKLEFLIVSNKVDMAKELWVALGGKNAEEAPVGHKWLNKLLGVFEIYSKRVDAFLKKENKASTKIDTTDLKFYTESISFRNEVATDLAKMKKAVKGLTTSELELPELPIRLHAKTPVVSLALAHVVENKYEEVKPYIEKRRELAKRINVKIEEPL